MVSPVPSRMIISTLVTMALGMIMVGCAWHLLPTLWSATRVTWSFTLEEKVLLDEVCSYLHWYFILIGGIHSWLSIFIFWRWTSSNAIHYYRTDISCPCIITLPRLINWVVLVVSIGMVGLVLFENLSAVLFRWCTGVGELCTLVDCTCVNLFAISYGLI